MDKVCDWCKFGLAVHEMWNHGRKTVDLKPNEGLEMCTKCINEYPHNYKKFKHNPELVTIKECKQCRTN